MCSRRGPAGSHPRVRAWPWDTPAGEVTAGWRPQRRLCRRGAVRGGGGRLAADHWSPLLIDTRLRIRRPGSLPRPAPPRGTGQRPLVEINALLRGDVLTCTLEVWRGRISPYKSYRPASWWGTTVGGSDAPERLPEVMGWRRGSSSFSFLSPWDPACAALPSAAQLPCGGGCERGTRPPTGDAYGVRLIPLISVDGVKRRRACSGRGCDGAADGRRGAAPNYHQARPCPDSRLGAARTVRWAARAAGRLPTRPVRPTSATPLAAAPIKRSVRYRSVPVPPRASAIAARDHRGKAPLPVPYRHRPSAAQAKKTPPWVSPCWRETTHGRTRPHPWRAPLSQPARPKHRWSRVGRKAPWPRSNPARRVLFFPSLSVKPSVANHPCAVGVRSSDQEPLTRRLRKARGSLPPPVVALASPAAAAVPVRQATPAPAKLPSDPTCLRSPCAEDRRSSAAAPLGNRLRRRRFFCDSRSLDHKPAQARPSVLKAVRRAKMRRSSTPARESEELACKRRDLRGQ